MHGVPLHNGLTSPLSDEPVNLLYTDCMAKASPIRHDGLACWAMGTVVMLCQ